MSPATPKKIQAEAIRAILVDDERLARKALRLLLKEHSSIEIVGEADGVEAAMSLVDELHPEVIFLDVQMSPLDGFALVNRLSLRDSAPKIVFVTAYDKFALPAFEAHALDYLTKPIVPERLAKTIARLKKTLMASRGISGAPEITSGKITPLSHPLAPLSELSLVPLQDGSLFIMAPVAEICAIQSEGDYTRILISDKKAMMMKIPIREWEERLPKSLFLRVSRGLMLNKKQMIKTVTQDRNRGEVHLSGITAPLIISRLEMKRIKESV